MENLYFYKSYSLIVIKQDQLKQVLVINRKNKKITQVDATELDGFLLDAHFDKIGKLIGILSIDNYSLLLTVSNHKPIVTNDTMSIFSLDDIEIRIVDHIQNEKDYLLLKDKCSDIVKLIK